MKISAACQLCNVRSVTVEHHLYKLDCVRLTAMRDCILPSQPYTVELVYNDHRWSCDRVVVIDKWSFKASLAKCALKKYILYTYINGLMTVPLWRTLDGMSESINKYMNKYIHKTRLFIFLHNLTWCTYFTEHNQMYIF